MKFFFVLLFCVSANFISAQERENCLPQNVEEHEGKDKQFPYDNYFIQRSYPDYNDILPAFENAKRVAWQQMNSVSRSLNFNLQWQLEGPTNIGGRVNTLAVDPTDNNVIYAGTSNGGIFKTVNGGISWVSAIDTLSYFAVGDIKIDPTDHNIIYAGLGDPNISGYPAIGNGIIKSTDGGNTWHNIGLSDTRIISKIEIHPLNHNLVYAGTMGLPYAKNNQRGLYKSVDGGNTWSQILFVSDSAGVIDLLLDNTDTNIVYAVTWNRIRQNLRGLIAGPDSKIWKSTNGGSTWTQLTNGLPTGTFSRIAIAKSSTNHNVLYAEYVDSSSLDLYGIYKTTNGGASWTALNVSQVAGQVQGGFGWYFGNLTVNPYNENEIYVLGVDLWRTNNGGSTWNQVGPSWWTYQVHADKHSLRFLNATTFILATDGGTYKTTDLGNTWSDIDEIPNTQFYHVSYNLHHPGTYYGGAQDNGTNSGSSSSLNGWISEFGGDGFQQRFNSSNGMVWYTETQNGAIVYTNDDGNSFNDATAGIDATDRRNWDMPYIISNANPTTLYTGTYRVYKSTGSYVPGWQVISGELTKTPLGKDSTFRTVSTIDESPVNANIVYAGTSDGNVWRSADAGNNWQKISDSLPNRFVTHVKASNVHSNVVFVSHSGYKDNDNFAHIHLSKDTGVTWLDIAGNLPPFAVNDIELSHLNDSLIFVATDGGVYFTIDLGSTWQRLGTNMPLFEVYDVELDETNHKLIAGTFARSMWSIDVDSILSVFSISLSASANDTICVGETAQLYASGASSYLWTPANTLSCSTCPNPIATPTITTTYYVAGSNGVVSSVDSVVVTVHSLPNDTLTQSNDTLFATPGYTYMWYLNGTLVANPNNNFLVVTTSGVYYAVAQNQYGCTKSSNSVHVIIGGISNVNADDVFKIYPNPVMEKITIEKLAEGNWTVVVRELSGREMEKFEIKKAKTEIELGTFSSGTYFVEFTNHTEKFIKRVMKF
jgi:photosystem II stability/assembly factor-like uncharacterized protein